MGYAADVIHGAAYEVDFLTPIAAPATGILNAAAGSVGQAITTGFGTDTADAPFGRNVVAGAGGSLTVVGKDYLGQGMTEVIPAGPGKKAFKWIDSITPSFGGSVSAGFGALLGLPYRMAAVVTEIANGVGAAPGTLVPGSLVDPQTSSTGDPRGTYAPTTALNGSNRILAVFKPYNLLNANGNGGLHGIQAA
jgi:hypothetical protein